MERFELVSCGWGRTGVARLEALELHRLKLKRHVICLAAPLCVSAAETSSRVSEVRVPYRIIPNRAKQTFDRKGLKFHSRSGRYTAVNTSEIGCRCRAGTFPKGEGSKSLCSVIHINFESMQGHTTYYL